MTYRQTRDRLLAEMDTLTIIDAHEHLGFEQERLDQELDVFSLFSVYTRGDLQRAGMTPGQCDALGDHTIPLERRWETFAPYWDRIRYTCYSRSVLHAVKHFYGWDDIGRDNYKDLSQAIAANSKPGIYKRVLRDACHIEKALTHHDGLQLGPETRDPILVPVMRLLWLPYWPADVRHSPGGITWNDLTGPESLPGWNHYVDMPVRTLDDFVEKSRLYLKRIKALGVKAVKMIAYTQQHPFDEPDRAAAERIFEDLKTGRIHKTRRVNPLFHYLLDQAIACAVEEGLVIAVHTGYWGDIRDISPLHMIPFLQRYPHGRFDLFHLGYPWLRESINLGKEFSNVHLNFCWLHVISQRAARDALDEALEMIPTNKLIGFGGDYNAPTLEKI